MELQLKVYNCKIFKSKYCSRASSSLIATCSRTTNYFQENQEKAKTFYQQSTIKWVDLKVLNFV